MIYFTEDFIHRLEKTANDWIDSHDEGVNSHITLTTLKDVSTLCRIMKEKIRYDLSELPDYTKIPIPYTPDYYMHVIDNDYDYDISNEDSYFNQLTERLDVPRELQAKLHVMALSLMERNNNYAIGRPLISMLKERLHVNHSDELINEDSDNEALKILIQEVDHVSKNKIDSYLNKVRANNVRNIQTSFNNEIRPYLYDPINDLKDKNLKLLFKNYFTNKRYLHIDINQLQDYKIPVGSPNAVTKRGIALFLGYKNWEVLMSQYKYLNHKSDLEYSDISIISPAMNIYEQVKKDNEVVMKFVASDVNTNIVNSDMEYSELRFLCVNKDNNNHTILQLLSKKGTFQDFEINRKMSLYKNLDYDNPATFNSNDSSKNITTEGLKLSDISIIQQEASLPKLRQAFRNSILEEVRVDIMETGYSQAERYLSSKGVKLRRKTIARFMGNEAYFNKGKVTRPNHKHLDIVAKYLGYESYHDFVQETGGTINEVPKNAKQHLMGDFEVGHQYRFTYNPEHLLDFEPVSREGKLAFKIYSIHGSHHLREGDVFTFKHVQRGIPLNLRIERNGVNIGNYDSTPLVEILKMVDGRWKNADGN